METEPGQSTGSPQKSISVRPIAITVSIAFVIVMLIALTGQHSNRGNQTEPVVVLAYTVTQLPDKPCLAVAKSALGIGPMPDLAAGTATDAPRLVSLLPNGTAVEVKSWMFSETERRLGPGSKIWLELAKGRVSELDGESRRVVDAVMANFPGVELRDAGEHPNWVPMTSGINHRLQPASGHAATECPDEDDPEPESMQTPNSPCGPGFVESNEPAAGPPGANPPEHICEPETRPTPKVSFSYAGISELSGTLELRTYYGPPGYGENPKEDEKEKQYILVLDSPINVGGGSRDPDDVPVPNVNEVTLIPSSPEHLQRYVGRKASFAGHLFGASTGHHHTPVLLGDARNVVR